MFDDIKGYCTSIRQDADGYVAILKPEHAINGMRTLLWRDDGWVTINGAHVLVGENGIVMGGAGGKFNGKNFSPDAMRFYKKRQAVKKARKYRAELSKGTPFTMTPAEAREGIANIDKNLKRKVLTPEQKEQRRVAQSKIRALDKQIKSASDTNELKRLIAQRSVLEVGMPRDTKKSAAEREKLLRLRRSYKNVVDTHEKQLAKANSIKAKNPGVDVLSERIAARDKRVRESRILLQANKLERSLTDKQKLALAKGEKSWGSMSEAERIVARKTQGMPKGMPFDMWDLYSNPLTVSKTNFGATWTGD